jgi:hypothetical protein
MTPVEARPPLKALVRDLFSDRPSDPSAVKPGISGIGVIAVFAIFRVLV